MGTQHNSDSHPFNLSPELSSASHFSEAIQLASLSAAQTRIVELLFEGKRDKEIAVEMQLSIHTVRTYLQRTFNRMGVTNRTELILKIAALQCTSCNHPQCPNK